MLKLLLVACGIAYGQQTAVVGTYRDFGGGLNTDSASIAIAPNESPDLLNVQIDNPVGALTQRNGYATCGTTPSGNTGTNLYEYVKTTGARYLIVTDNVTVWQTQDCVNFSTVTTGQSSASVPRFATVLDDLWVVNGTTWPIVWNGATATQLDGNGGRPTGYKGKYIAYWKSRVWIANTPTAPSSVYFSALVSTSGVTLDPETAPLAWSDLNQIYINRDDGSGITGLKPYRDNLYVAKETGWNRIVFESEYDLAVAKNVTSIGTKFQESIVEMDDGLLRFVGRDGVYAFDGVSVKKMSSKWTPTFETFKQPTRSEQYLLWDTPADFVAGSLSNTTTSYSSGEIALDFDVSSRAYNVFSTTSVWTLSNIIASIPSGNNSVFMYSLPKSGVAYLSTTTINFGNWGMRYKTYRDITTRWYFISSTASTSTTSGYALEMKTTSSYTNMEVRLYSVSNGALTEISNDLTNTTYDSIPLQTGSAAKGCDVAINRSVAGYFTVTSNGCGISMSADTSIVSQTNPYSMIHTFGSTTPELYIASVSVPGSFYPTGVYYSPISTFTSLSAWGNFSADETLNGQTISYSVRTGTSAYNCNLNAWQTITPGAIVSTTTDAYAQWKATFTTTDTSVTPLLDSVSMGYITGANSLSLLGGINYKAHYWITGSTTLANSYNDIVMVESDGNPTYTRYDLPLSAMTLWNNNLYATISNTSKIARVDYGSTDDGATISSYWTSRDEVYDNPIFYKTVNTVILDYDNTPANTGLSISLSPDFGTTYTDRTVAPNLSTLPRNTAKLNYPGNTSLSWRTKLSNSVLGVGFKIYGIYNMGKVTQFYGN